MIDIVLTTTLTRVAALFADAREPWWLIGSAAVALHGAPVVVTRDVDVLVDAADMPMLAAKTGAVPRPGAPDERFRSAQVLRLGEAPLAIEIFAGFEVYDANGRWRRLWPTTRVFVDHGGVALPVPAVAELLEMLTRFGRDKDLARAQLLRAVQRS